MSDNKIDDLSDGLIAEVLKWFTVIPKKDRATIKTILFDNAKPVDDHIDSVTFKVNIYIAYSSLICKIYNIKKIFKGTLNIDLKKIINYQELYNIVETHHIEFWSLYKNSDHFKIFTEHMFSIISIERVMKVYPDLLNNMMDSYTETYKVPIIEVNSKTYNFIKHHSKYIEKKYKNEYEINSINTFIYYIFLYSEKTTIVERYKNSYNLISPIGLNYVCSYKNIKHIFKFYIEFTKTASKINVIYDHYDVNTKSLVILKMLDIAAMDYIDTLYNSVLLLSEEKIRHKIIKDTLL